MSGAVDLLTDLSMVTCFRCGVVFGMPQTLWSTVYNDGSDFWCPNGHKQAYCESQVDRLKKELEAEQNKTKNAKKRIEWAKQDLKIEQNSHRATKGHLTRQKKRIAGGVCPCCKRSFKQLARHMKTKHPNFVEAEKK